MTDADENESTADKRRPLGLLSIVLLGLAAIVIGALFVIRSSRDEGDHAFANAATVLFPTIAWILSVTALWISRLPRLWWRTLFVVPVTAVTVFFSLNRFRRFDGELWPVFEPRWTEQSTTATAYPELPGTETAAFEPRDTDFAQFFGPNRNGQVDGLSLATDWSNDPPEILWKIDIGEGWSGFAVQGDVAVTLEQQGEQEWVSAFDVMTGTRLWHYAMPGLHQHLMGGVGPRSTPVISGDRVWAISAVDKLVCLSLTDGELVWEAELLKTPQAEFEAAVTWGRSGSPLLDDGKLYVPVGGVHEGAKTIVVCDAASGEVLQEFGDDQISYSSPIIATLGGQRQLIYTSEKHIAGYDLANGEQLWSADAPGVSSADANVAQPVVVDDSHVLVTKSYGIGGHLWKIIRDGDRWSVDSVWEKTAILKTKFTSAVVHEGFAYALSDGILECVDVMSGERKWKRGRYRQGQLLLVGDVLLITSEDGRVVLVRAQPDKFEELAEFAVIGDVSWNTPALSGNRLLIRNSDEAACVILPLAETTSPEELEESEAPPVQEDAA